MSEDREYLSNEEPRVSSTTTVILASRRDLINNDSASAQQELFELFNISDSLIFSFKIAYVDGQFVLVKREDCEYPTDDDEKMFCDRVPSCSMTTDETRLFVSNGYADVCSSVEPDELDWSTDTY